MNNHYSFTLPKLRRSIKPIQIRDSSNSDIGRLQLYYKTKVDELFDRHLSLIDKSNYQCILAGQKDIIELRAKSVRKTLFKQRWTIHKDNNKKLGTLINESKIKLHPKYSYVTENQTFTIISDLGSKTIEMTNEAGEQVVTSSYDGAIFLGDAQLIIHKQDLLILEEILLITFISVKPMD
ncbi:tubby C-terminal domain-like protein [Alkalicoccobacillus porphyridii]|uniref:Tubby C-terminal domain-containing protein n=1 Tax=Alkalicoccobacillus porphyridii TaxID=2597270 RepID=A0A553ZWD0_9BACI|nr:hypothetical protein [Alkalicoccobacillus porphyridii]TSB45733.1 hypothetical protein FN960_14695 [Alkalicoccobacillus porphyridii]